METAKNELGLVQGDSYEEDYLKGLCNFVEETFLVPMGATSLNATNFDHYNEDKKDLFTEEDLHDKEGYYVQLELF